MLWKQRKRSSDNPAFLINSLRQEEDDEVNQERIASIMGSWSGGILKRKRYSIKYFFNITGQHRVILEGNIKEREGMSFYLFQLIGTQFLNTISKDERLQFLLIRYRENWIFLKNFF